ncbi:18573_t:CDS:2 [Gigaspora margarita]|uniref:18573_t:CDS:1 n=1 Tax=Gigaspora margarita TaxID=4874 RepID=A0ABN7VW37_GIGMA|nr:18573_t:CDS:2 [Gigaspora margarita]
MSMKAIKKLFNDHSMFIEAIKTISLLARLYCARWERGELSEEITEPFKFGKFCEIEKKINKKYVNSLNKYNIQEYETTLEGNKMLMDGVHSLKVFKHNAEKV